jgi:hypothetical protein
MKSPVNASVSIGVMPSDVMKGSSRFRSKAVNHELRHR